MKLFAPARLTAISVVLLFAPFAHSEQPNIVLISVDTLRADHCSAYGYRRETTPRLSQLAREGILFRQAYAPMGHTGPSHATLFTGLYPTAHGVIKNGKVLPETQVTLAERLGEAGYDTAAFVSAFPLERRFGLNQGFATYDDEFLRGQETIDIKDWLGEKPENAFDRRGDYTISRAVKWLEDRTADSAPFFLFIHLFDPHSPYKPPEAALRQVLGSERPRDPLKITHALYDGEIRFADQLVGYLLDRLEESAVNENTITVVTSDHGEGLMQRGFLLHGLFVYEEEVRVPLVIRWPDKLTAGRAINEPMTIADLVPTLLDFASLSAEPDSFQGQSLAKAVLDGGNIPYDRPVFFMRPRFPKTTLASGWSGRLPDGRPPPRLSVHGAQYGVRVDHWKYIIGPEEGIAELYNLQSDPQERENLRERNESIAELMHKRLNTWLEDAPADVTADELLDDETRQALEALGYTN